MAQQLREAARAERPARSSESPFASSECPTIETGDSERANGLSEDLLAGELLRRRRARESLAEYARSIDIPGAPVSENPEEEVFKRVESAMALHHRVICDALQACVEKPGGGGRLMIFAPPGSAKSSYASVVMPSWLMAKHPGQRVMVASYASELAETQSRKTRQLCRSDRHISIWPEKPTLAGDQRAIADWALTNGSAFMARGFQGGITGNRANGIVIDDPVKNREEADSETIRNKTKAEYNESALTRLLPRGWIVIIQTRWHEDDLSGGILPEGYDGRSGSVACRDGQTWEVLNIPAKCEYPDDPLGRELGEYLWPEWFPASHWKNWEDNPQAQRTWAALFQQRPTAAEGIEFKREWFKWYDPDLAPGMPSVLERAPGRPKYLTPYGATDFATKKDKGDFTEHGVVGVDRNHDLWFVDWWFGQKTTDVTSKQLVMMGGLWRTRKWAHEGGVIGNAVTPMLHAEMRGAKTYVLLEELPSNNNKVLKVASFQARAAAGTVWLPTNRPWAKRLVDQLCAFPAGRYDDAVDVCGLIGRMIDQMAAPYDPKIERKPGIQPFTEAWLMANEQPETKIRYT